MFVYGIALAAVAAWPIAMAHADNLKTDFALYDQEGLSPDVSVQCGAAFAHNKAAPFTMHITMSNRSAIGGVQRPGPRQISRRGPGGLRDPGGHYGSDHARRGRLAGYG